eukprot:TRINITY_DN4094_c0_g1_i1.p1 TRINITY_DN4094_c0_g1~~TRINITY_DN4094_c0_g1_i1.p1  ORF type:complete len:800 (+),score=206.79 TRINITY_DN4094_c0_g1_i1:24-2402(+)
MAPKTAAAGILDIGWAKRILSDDSERHALCDREFALADAEGSGGLDVEEVGNVVSKICRSMNLPLLERDKMSELIRTVKHSDTDENRSLQKMEFRMAFKAVLRACLHEAEEEQRRRNKEGLSPPRQRFREPSEKSDRSDEPTSPPPIVMGSGSEAVASPLLWQLSLRVQSAEREIKECRKVLDKFALFEAKVLDLDSRHQSLGSQLQALATAGNGQAENTSKQIAFQGADEISHSVEKMQLVDTKVKEFEKKLQLSEQKTSQFVDALQSLHKEMQSHKERLAGCDSEVLAVQQADRNRREQLDKHSQELGSVAEHFRQIEAKLEGIETRAPQCEQKLVQIECMLLSLKTDVESQHRQLEDRLDGMEASPSKIPQSEEKLVQLESVVDCLRHEIDAHSRQLETKLEDVQVPKPDMKSQSRQLEMKLEGLEVKLEGMEARIPQSDQRLPQLECAVEDLKSEIQAQRTRLVSLDAQRLAAAQEDHGCRAQSLGHEICDQTLRQLEAKVEDHASRLDSLDVEDLASRLDSLDDAERQGNRGGLDDEWRLQVESQLRQLQDVRHALEQRQASQERLFQLDGFVHESPRQALPVLQGVNMKLQSLVKQVDRLQVITADAGPQPQQAVSETPDVLFSELQALKDCITAAEVAASSLLKAGAPAAAIYPSVAEVQVVRGCIAAGQDAIQSLVPRLQEAAAFALPAQNQVLPEMRALKECIAAGEAAMHSLAPRLRQTGTPHQPAAVAPTVAAVATSAPKCAGEAAAAAKRLAPDAAPMPRAQEGACTGCLDGIMKLRGAT